MVKISVIVPVYKAEKYLDRCVESILKQSFADFELILVDDGSPDGCGAMCDTYAAKDSRVRVIHKENGGVSTARNAGLDAAEGEFVAFIDSDDYVDAEYLRVLMQKKDCGMSLCGAVKHFADGTAAVHLELPEETVPVTPQLLPRWLEEGRLYTVWGKAYRRDMLLRGGIRFRQDMCYGEDSVFAMEAARLCQSVSFSSKILYHYIKHPGESLTGSISEKSVGSYDAFDRFVGQWLSELGVASALYESGNFPSKRKLRWAFYEIFEEKTMPVKEKLGWYRLFFSLKTFRENIDVLFPEFPGRLRMLLKLGSPRLLALYQHLAG